MMTMKCSIVGSGAAVALWLGAASVAQAQPLGSFTWQLQPFCNRVTMNVRQDGAVYTLDGFDDQCGAGRRAPLVGLGTPNPDGSIGFGLHIVATGGKAVSIDARVSLAGLGGTWTDSAGNTGTMAFGANTGGSPRPPAGVGPGDITAVLPGTGLSGGGAAGDVTLSVDPAMVQSRVTQTCPAGQAVRAVAQNGTVTCEPVSGGTGDITAVIAGVGLLGGATNGDATLDVVFSGDGVSPAAARADHEHAIIGLRNTAVGFKALAGIPGAANTALGAGALTLMGEFGSSNTGVGSQALRLNVDGDNNIAVGADALELSTGSSNTAVGTSALQALGVGNANTALGRTTLSNLTAGSGNTAIGLDAGNSPSALTDVTLIGGSSDALSGMINATALGAKARVDQSNSIVLGSINFVNGATSDVNVGIGTTSPDGRLEIATQDFARDILITTADGAPDLVTQASEGLLVSPLASASGSLLFNLRAHGYTGTAFQESANITVRTTEAWTGSASGARIEFSTTPNGTTNRANRMVIDHDGEVGIGTINPLDRLHVVGDIRVGTTGTNGCLKGNGGAAIAGTCSSDARFKRDITPFGPALERVTALRPVHYFWRAAAFPEKGFGTEQTYGLIAQEVEQVLPEIVTTDADGFKAVDYAKLPLLLLQAVRELKDENDALKARMATFEALLASSTPAPRKH